MRICSLSLLFLLFSLSLPAFADDHCDWQKIATPPDHDRVLVSMNDVAARIPADDAMPSYLSGDLKDESASALSIARTLVQRAQQPLPLGKITGDWRVRSIQVSADHAFDYPYFAARIDDQACGLHFSKRTGSQRRSGELMAIADDDRQRAFLGTSTVNDDATGRYSADNAAGGASAQNSVGRLLRIGADELLMILDFGPDGFELYQLKR